MAFRPLATLTTANDQAICVRIIHVWEARLPKKANFLSLDALILDEQGNMVQLTCPHHMAHLFRNALTENLGRVVRMSGFHVAPNFKNYRYAQSHCSIHVTRNTIIRSYDSTPLNIGMFKYDFISWNEISMRCDSVKQTMDVIGQLAKVVYPAHDDFTGKNAPNKVLTLYGLEFAQVEVALWPPFDEEFPANKIIDLSKVEPVIIAFTGLLAKRFGEAPRLYTTSGTSIKINNEISVFDQYNNRFAKISIEVIDEKEQQVPANVGNKTVSKLLAIDAEVDQGTRFSCEATVVNIDTEKGWWYKGCPDSKCRMGVKMYDGAFLCRVHGPVARWVPRYNITLEVSDRVDVAKFLLFDDIAKSLLKMPADMVKKEEDRRIMPPWMIDALMDLHKIFNVTVNHPKDSTSELTFIVKRMIDIPAEIETIEGPSNDSTSETLPITRSTKNPLAPKTPGEGTSHSRTTRDKLTPSMMTIARSSSRSAAATSSSVETPIVSTAAPPSISTEKDVTEPLLAGVDKTTHIAKEKSAETSHILSSLDIDKPMETLIQVKNTKKSSPQENKGKSTKRTLLFGDEDDENMPIESLKKPKVISQKLVPVKIEKDDTRKDTRKQKDTIDHHIATIKGGDSTRKT